MLNKKNSDKIDYRRLNEVMSLSSKILKIVFFLVIIFGIYGVILLLKELKFMPFILTILKVVSPLFIGFFIAWLFEPAVKWLNHKGIRRGIGAALVYTVLLGVLFLICLAIVPILIDQINDFAQMVPGVFLSVKDWATEVFAKLSQFNGIDTLSLQQSFLAKMEEFAIGLTTSLPDTVVSVITSIFSGFGIVVIGLIIGFYLLVSFEDTTDSIITILPKKMHKDARDLANEVNTSLRRFVTGALLDCFLVFVITSTFFGIIGLKAPLLFGLFCGLTNIIPYAGPYIGGAPAAIVGFTTSPLIGILVIVIVAVVQFLEGNFLQPIIMSKTVKLHPVTVIIGLLIFGYFWGVIGMIIATPLIAVTKAIVNFFDDKYNFLGFRKKVAKIQQLVL